jgi:threonine aldolase
MNFASDNAYGAAPEMIDALREAYSGAAASYGADQITARLQVDMSRLFEHDVIVYPVVTGTAANALALATLVPPHGAILCHEEAHIAVDECGAPEFFTHGAKLVALAGRDARLSPETIVDALARFHRGFVHHPQPAAISITQATELGTCYRPNEIAAISEIAREHGLKLHMDGARFANAIAYLGCSPADATWKAGVDALSFGATKNGALCAEAVVFFNPDDVRDFEYRRKKSGHLLSKMRFVSAQLAAYLKDGRWLATATRANALAQRLSQGLKAIPGVEIAHPVEGNAVFVSMPDTIIARLRASGAVFYDWAPPAGGRTLIRLVTSFATPETDVENYLDIVRRTA